MTRRPDTDACGGAGVRADTERDLAVLADRIGNGADAFLGAIPPGTADEQRPWLVSGTTVALSTLTCHLLNESLVHG